MTYNVSSGTLNPTTPYLYLFGNHKLIFLPVFDNSYPMFFGPANHCTKK